MIMRQWTATVMTEKAEAYEAFARDASLPMFRASPGCISVLMARDGCRCRVITVWRSAADIADLEASPRYRETVRLILAAGFLKGAQHTTVAEVHLAWASGDGPVPGT